MPHVVTIMRRYNKDLALRISEEQRSFLEKMAAAEGCGICEAARGILDEAMRARGLLA